MPIQINGQCNRIELFERIEKVEQSLLEKFSENDDESSKASLAKFTQFLKTMNVWAKDYDYKNVEANGFRCLLVAAIRFLEYADKNFNCSELFNEDFRVLLTNVNLIAERLDELRVLTENSRKGIFLEDENVLIDALHSYITSDAIVNLCGSFAGFEVDFITRSAYILTGSYLAANRVEFTSVKDVARCFYDARFRAQNMVDLTHKLDIAVIKRIINWGEIWWVRKYLPWANHTLWPSVVETVYVERQSKWLIKCSPKEQNIWLEKNGEAPSVSPVRCRLIYHPTNDGAHEKEFGNLIIHVHGGGFVAGSPESHEVYTRGWAHHMPGTAIISVDYSRTPEARFPTPIQELLDVYLHFTSGNDTILKYTPKNIVLVGDSCGSCMVSSLIVVLNDMRRMGETIVMPKELVGFYPVFSLRNYEIAPSFYTSIFHPFLMPQVIMCLMDSYVPQTEEEMKMNEDDVKDAEPESDGSFMGNLYKWGRDAMKRYLWIWLFVDKKSTPWFMQGRDRIAQKLKSAKKMTGHPYMSPMYYEHLDEIAAETGLTLVALDMDPTLDYSIAMANKWKGKVDLDVVRDMPHAFLNFVSFAGKYWDAYYYGVDKMKKVMGYEQTFQHCYNY